MKKIIALAFGLLTLASCDTPQSRFQALTEEFMDQNMTATDRTDVTFGRFDSTANVTPERITTLHKKANSIPFYKKDIKYSKPTDKLFYSTVTYNVTEKDGKVTKCKQTFYADYNLTNIVAFMDIPVQ